MTAVGIRPTTWGMVATTRIDRLLQESPTTLNMKVDTRVKKNAQLDTLGPL